jgi:hypothetical protein
MFGTVFHFDVAFRMGGKPSEQPVRKANPKKNTVSKIVPPVQHGTPFQNNVQMQPFPPLRKSKPKWNAVPKRRFRNMCKF